MDSQSKKIKIYHILEKFALVLFVSLVIILSESVWSFGFTNDQFVYGIIIGISLVLLVVFLQYLVSKQIDLMVGQTNYAEEDIFNALYQRSPVAYLTLNKQDKISRANPAAIKLLKTQVDNITKIDLFDLIDIEDDSLSVLKSKISNSHTINDKEIAIKNTAEETVWVMLSVYPYRNDGEKLVSMVDITEQKNIDTAKTEFVALATHQLRTPISAIRWNVELLTKSIKPDESEVQARYLDKINRNVMRMINLINDFLSVSKLEMGTYASKPVDINLTEFFNSIVDEFSGKIAEKNLEVKIIGRPEDKIIRTDDRLIHIVISNLVSNAVKYLNPDGELNVVYQEDTNGVEIIISDNGIGIPESEIDNLFTKFYRASNAQSHNTQGTGLGLYIVKESVAQLGGDIKVDSKENQGTKFTIHLPAN